MRVVHWLALVAALIVCTRASPVFSPQIDPSYVTIASTRGAYGRVVHLYGDSLMRGWALRRFPDELNAEQRRAEPNWRHRSPAAMLNSTAWQAGAVAVFAGNTGQPGGADVDALRESIAIGVIRPGDIVVLEDSGRHEGDPVAYAANWLALRRALANAGVTIIMITVPDAITQETISGAPAHLFRYDAPFNGVTHNAATANAARAPIEGSSRTILIELNETLEVPGRLHRDGIHPNICGQCIMTAAIATAAELPVPNCPYRPPRQS
jgi:hypothetical protein